MHIILWWFGTCVWDNWIFSFGCRGYMCNSMMSKNWLHILLRSFSVLCIHFAEYLFTGGPCWTTIAWCGHIHVLKSGLCDCFKYMINMTVTYNVKVCVIYSMTGTQKLCLWWSKGLCAWFFDYLVRSGSNLFVYLCK